MRTTDNQQPATFSRFFIVVVPSGAMDVFFYLAKAKTPDTKPAF
jgi:hypothetical protein